MYHTPDQRSANAIGSNLKHVRSHVDYGDRTKCEKGRGSPHWPPPLPRGGEWGLRVGTREYSSEQRGQRLWESWKYTTQSLQSSLSLPWHFNSTNNNRKGIRGGRVVRCRTCDREVAGSNPALGCCVPTPTHRAIPPGSVNDYQRKLGSKRA